MNDLKNKIAYQRQVDMLKGEIANYEQASKSSQFATYNANKANLLKDKLETVIAAELIRNQENADTAA
tara:strand:+ start:2065 stop:2268 length:204 start_codon:yes stop_codon:yes gene_type:complete